MRTGIRWLSWPVVVAFLLAASSGGCTHAQIGDGRAESPASLVPVGSDTLEGKVVVAVVERMERMAHTESLLDGTTFVSNVLALGVVAPERFDTMLFVHMKGHPHIGGRPLLLGDVVTFVLPGNWRNRDLALEELKELDFQEETETR